MSAGSGQRRNNDRLSCVGSQRNTTRLLRTYSRRIFVQSSHSPSDEVPVSRRCADEGEVRSACMAPLKTPFAPRDAAAVMIGMAGGGGKGGAGREGGGGQQAA
eukprot:scaffold6041_cov54-Phaeocystis_antarctica.AAC.1